VIKLKGKENITAVFLIVILISLYTLPLLLNIDKGLLFARKNYEGMWYATCFGTYYYYRSIIKDHTLPFWGCFLGGGFFNLTCPDDMTFNPFSLLVLTFGVLKGINLHYYLMYLLGALSMFYLARFVLKYNIAGSIYSGLVFSMCGFFPLMQMKGFIFARETVFLPLLTAFFLKAASSNRYILLVALLLSFFLMQTGLYFAIVVLFLFILSLLSSFFYESGRIFQKKRYMVIFFGSLIICLCLSIWKIFLLFDFLKIDSGRLEGTYPQCIERANTVLSLINNLVSPENSSRYMYIGWVPLLLGLVSGLILFKKVWKWVVILLVFCVLSLGHNSFVDLHYLLWHLPIFNAIDEPDKYYGLIIIFSISLLAGSFFTIIKKFFPNRRGVFVSGILIIFTFFNLLLINGPYFNIYKATLIINNQPGKFQQAKMINYQEGDDTGMAVLAFSLYLKGIGVLNQRYDRYFQKLNNKNISSKYFIMPEYVFLSPSTKLISIANPSYKGEVFFRKDENKAELLSITPQDIKIDVNLKSRDRLVINQNYSKWWRSRQGSVSNNNGLLSVSLDKLGDYEVNLYFVPFNFYAGIGVSILSIISLGFALLRRKS